MDSAVPMEKGAQRCRGSRGSRDGGAEDAAHAQRRDSGLRYTHRRVQTLQTRPRAHRSPLREGKRGRGGGGGGAEPIHMYKRAHTCPALLRPRAASALLRLLCHRAHRPRAAVRTRAPTPGASGHTETRRTVAPTGAPTPGAQQPRLCTQAPRTEAPGDTTLLCPRAHRSQNGEGRQAGYK